MSKVRPYHFWNARPKTGGKGFTDCFTCGGQQRTRRKEFIGKKPLLPAKWKAVGKAFATYQHDSRQRRCTSSPINMTVGKEDVRRCEMTERIPFAYCHAVVGKGFF